MCNLVPGQVSITGTSEAMNRLREQWDGLPSVQLLGLPQPQPVSFDELPIGHPFGMPEAPAVARVFHTYSDEPGIASLLQADALHREVNVVIEPVHVVGLCPHKACLRVVGPTPRI
jgi:hypothetical protein